MIKPSTPPPYPFTDSTHTANYFPPDVKAPPTPSDPTPSNSTLSNTSHANPGEEAQWQASLQNFEQQMISYQHNARVGGTAEEASARRVVEAMEHVADSHTNPKVKAHWTKTAIRFKKAQPKEREGIVVAILKGFLILLTLPFHIVGIVFHTAGEVIDGLGFLLKSTGQVAKKLTYEGGPFFKR